ncbi:hypothetical protein PS15m_002595 [Mucor circinelloides]
MIQLQLSYSNSSIPLDATGLVTTQGLGYVSGQIKQLLQHSLAKIEILKAGKVWGENSENSAGFLKRTAVTRENMRSITELKYPDTGELCCSSQHGMSTIIANNFYITLFTPPDPTDTIILNTLIRFIPSYLKLSNDQQESLMLLLLLDIEELLEDSKYKHTRRLSSPGHLAYYIDPRSPRGSSIPGFFQYLVLPSQRN